MRRQTGLAVVTATAAMLSTSVIATTSAWSNPGNTRLTNDAAALGGYTSDFTLVTGAPYTDAVLDACSQSRGRQNEPAVAMDPRNPDVLVGSSNDYCGVFNSDGTFVNGVGPVWMGYYRSENAGASFVSSLIPGYPGDTSPYAANAHVRTSGAGDPVLAWDSHGRLFAGSESSGDPAGSAKTFGDEWVATYQNPAGPNGATSDDGKQFVQSVTVASGSASPTAGKFNDKTAIEVDRTGGACDGTVYFAWSRFSGGGSNGFNSSIYIVRSTNHGRTFSAPLKISQTVHDIQNPDISVTGDGHVYVTYRQFASVRSNETHDAIAYNASTDCGQTFSAARNVQTFEPYDPVDVLTTGGTNGECGDDPETCVSGFTFMRGDTQVRSTADQSDANHDYIYVVYDPSIPGTEVATGTTYGSVVSGDLPAKYHQDIGSQSGIYFFRLDGATGSHTTPTLVDDPRTRGGLQRFPDISVDQGSMHVLWWDSRNDSCYSATRPVGNCANGTTVPALDVFAKSGSTSTLTWSSGTTRLSDQTTAPNWEQFGGRTVPFGGDYLWVTSIGGSAYGVWTDWRNVLAGTDQREGADADADSADVHQCRAALPTGGFSADTCPWDGGLDQNIYGAVAP